MIGAIESIRDNTAWLEARTKIEANEQAERSFRQSLQILHEINMGLTETESTRELTREAVELGRSRLGFDRLGIWLATDKPNTFAGSFGVDEQGKLRNEEDSRITVKRDRLLLRVVANQLPLAVVEDDDLLDDHRHVVGKGMRALAPLWDGQKVIGFVSTDNLLTKEPISQQKAEIFRLFASSLGHLYTRKQTERALRLERDFANTIIETAQAVILVLDRQCRIVRINPFGEELLGYTMAEVAGKDWISTFVPAHERDRIQEVFSSAVNDIQTRGNVNGVVTRDGRIRQVEWHDKTIKDAEGNCAGLRRSFGNLRRWRQ